MLANLEVRLFNKQHWLKNGTDEQSARPLIRRVSLAWILTTKIFYCGGYNFADSVHQLLCSNSAAV